MSKQKLFDDIIMHNIARKVERTSLEDLEEVKAVLMNPSTTQVKDIVPVLREVFGLTYYEACWFVAKIKEDLSEGSSNTTIH